MATDEEIGEIMRNLHTRKCSRKHISQYVTTACRRMRKEVYQSIEQKAREDEREKVMQRHRDEVRKHGNYMKPFEILTLCEFKNNELRTRKDSKNEGGHSLDFTPKKVE